MRQAIVDVHNKLREDLALGKVQGSSFWGDKLPKAADMRQMRYDCTLEKKALDDGVFKDNCTEVPPRQAFTDTGRNYRSITTMLFRRPLITPKDALVKVSNE
ncbi:hypothetical protein TELCIR_22454 [Teladorsagia circumcincta]|uniref:SCP domain-containing protein n=1 Tax=Teladorsagia circumcincta TaxID=45464 RepID=A0A2G9TDX1_TELCI|nr:hypothetical protein TELCIR_22454 [Teladorsagia circumcincta]